MLRRYNSKSLDTILLKNRRTTIGSATTCDVVVKGKGISPVHASIESNSSGFWLREHSLSGMTRVNEAPVFGQVEIRSGDLIQVGTAAPFVFDSEWMFGTRPNSAKMSKERGEMPVSAVPAAPSEGTILPVIGKKITPQSQNHQQRRSGNQSLRSSASSTESSNRAAYSKSIGNNLLQRVVKLQAEVIAKDEKIRQLTSSPSFAPHFYYQPSLPPPPPPPPSSSVALPVSAHSSHPRQRLLSRASAPEAAKSFELFAYRAFIGAIASQLRQFNDRVLRTPQRDSAELFTAMCRAVDVPLSARIGDVEKYCEAVLIDNDFEDSEQLVGRLDNFLRESRREKIVELTNELEVIMPLIRDAASNARENIKVCNVFTQWSRQFGDLLRKSSFSATILFQAIDDLKTQFSDAHMSRHWLPPSITPILRLAALELEKRDGGVSPRSMSPAPQMLRKASIDMTLDSCISQVEAIVHEMDYHVVRLYNKAKDYSSFQSLDLESVSRVSKVVGSMKTSIAMLSEHAFKDEPVARPHSVLFFEITNDDITSTIRKSEGSTSSLGSVGSASSTGSLSNVKKVSAAPKITDPLSEDDEIVEERKELENRMRHVVEKIGDVLGTEETSDETEGLISVDASVLKMLIKQSQRLLDSYELTSSGEHSRRKRSEPPTIVVEEELKDAPEESSKPEVSPESPTSPEPSEDPESPTPTQDSPDVTSPIPEESSEISDDDRIVVTPESLNSEDVDAPSEEKEEEEEVPSIEKSDDVAEMTTLNESKPLRSAFSEDLERWGTRQNSIEKARAPANSLIDDESEEEEEEEDVKEPDDVEKSEDVVKPEAVDEEEEEEEEEEDRNPFTDDEKSTIRYVPKSAGSQTTPDLSPQSSLPVSDGPRSRSEEQKMSSHLRSHFNTANGKPHITYQYPIRKYYSPPMKRRSKSEDQKIRDALSNRPPFVLY